MAKNKPAGKTPGIVGKKSALSCVSVSKKIVVVTGGGGRLGSVVVPLLAKKYFLRLLVIERNGPQKRFAKLIKDGCVDLVQCDLSDGRASNMLLLARACRGAFAVLNMAGLTDPSASKQALYNANVLPTKNILEAARREKVEKIVHISSTGVYGAPAKLPCDESCDFAPIYAYGESKLQGEQLVAQSDFKKVILRPTVLYGAATANQFESLAKMLLSGKAVLVGDGTNRLPFVHERDVAQAIELALRKDVVGDFILCGDDELMQSRAWELVAKELGVAPPSKKVSLLQAKLAGLFSSFKARLLSRKPSFSLELLDVIAADRAFSNSKAKKILGWKPKEMLANALGEMARQWRLQN